MLLNILRQAPTRHPRRNELEGVESDTQKGEDVRMIQAFPYHSFSAECLRGWLVVVGRESGGVEKVP